MTELLGQFLIIFILGIIVMIAIAAYIIAFPKIQKWGTGENGKLIPRRIPGILLYFLIPILFFGWMVFSLLSCYLDFI